MAISGFIGRPDPPPSEQGVFAFGTRAAIFGHNAPRFASLPSGSGYTKDWDKTEPAVWDDSQGNDHEGAFDLERAVPGIVPRSWAVLAGEQRPNLVG